MSLQVPTTAELKAIITAQFEAKLSQTIPFLPKDPLDVIAKVMAAVVVTLYKYGGFIFLQMFPQFASTETTTINGKQVIPLVEWGRLVGVGDPTAATRFEGEIDITVTNQTGSLPAGTQLTNVTTGVTYLTLAAVLLDAATVQADIRASGDQDNNGGKGTIGNLQVGDIISFTNPIPNVASDATVAAVDVTAADAEDWEVYRDRVIGRFRNQPQGGALIDYVLWAEEVEGIINAYPYTGDPGIVNVYCEATEASSGSADGIPTGAQLTAVEASIELDDAGLASRRPINAFVNALAITRSSFDVAVDGLVVEDESTVQAAIIEALTSYFLSREPYLAGLTLGTRRDRITNAAVGGAVQDVVSAYDGVFNSVIVSETGGDDFLIYPLGEGEKAKAVNVTFPN